MSRRGGRRRRELVAGAGAVAVTGLAVATNIATGDSLPAWLGWLQPPWHAWVTVGVLAAGTATLAVVALWTDPDPRPALDFEPIRDRSVRVGTQSGGLNVTGDSNRVTTTSGDGPTLVVGEMSGSAATGPALAPGGTVIQAPGGNIHLTVASGPVVSGELSGELPRIGELADPFAYEVHAAIAGPAGCVLPVLPVYVRRAHDQRLSDAVERVLGGASQHLGVSAGHPARHQPLQPAIPSCGQVLRMTVWTGRRATPHAARMARRCPSPISADGAYA